VAAQRAPPPAAGDRLLPIGVLITPDPLHLAGAINGKTYHLPTGVRAPPPICFSWEGSSGRPMGLALFSAALLVTSLGCVTAILICAFERMFSPVCWALLREQPDSTPMETGA
jgi:hypothetical protein